MNPNRKLIEVFSSYLVVDSSVTFDVSKSDSL